MHCVRIMLAACFFLCMITGIPQTVLANEISLHMEVGEPGQKTSSYSVGQSHRWYIRSALPEDWSDVSDMTVLQTLSPSLTLDPVSVSVKLVQETGEKILLRMEEHYMLTAGSVFVEEGTADRLYISLTREGIIFLEQYQVAGSHLEISYSAKINANASMGVQLLGMAQLNITDNSGKKCIYLSDKAVTSTGGFHIRLTDATRAEPATGTFMLAREATPEEMEDNTVFKELLDIGNDTLAVIYERFYSSPDLTAEKTDRMITDENGIAACYGLAYGTYYLVQTGVGEGRMLPSGPVQVRIHEASHITAEDGWLEAKGVTADHTVWVSCSSPIMPRTGGHGTAPYTLSGLAVVLCACLLLWYNRKGNYLPK